MILYAVQNSDGQWFRSKGYGGYGKSWVDDIATARIYGKIGPARATVTFFANKYPERPYPMITELYIHNFIQLDETERINKSRKAKLKREQDRDIRDKKYLLKRAQENLADAQRVIDQMTGE